MIYILIVEAVHSMYDRIGMVVDTSQGRGSWLLRFGWVGEYNVPIREQKHLRKK